MPPRSDLKHILLPASEGIAFTPVTGFPAGERPPLTARQSRFLHANRLVGEVDTVIQQHTEMVAAFRVADPEVEITAGVSIDIEGRIPMEGLPETGLDATSLENRHGNPIEVLNVRIDENGKTYATIFVPESRIEFFKRKFQTYRDNAQTDPSNTGNAALKIDAVDAIRIADLNSFWMDDSERPQDTAQVNTWEVWLRKGFHQKLFDNATRLNIRVSQHMMAFQECEICLITASQDSLALIQAALSPLVGFSFREDTAGFFIDLPPREQADWAEDLARRVQHSSEDAPAVCILDTGIHRQHSLIEPSLAANDMDSYDPTWGTGDHAGHGTQVAGVALFEDVAKHLGNTNPIQLTHRLESVKILPPQGQNQEELYGYITQESASRAAVNAPRRKRVFCLAVTALGRNINGRPTAWSASLDKISVGLNDDLSIDDAQKQLFIVSAGNIRDTLQPTDYPARNLVVSIENPAQSWNALSVGGMTHKAASNDPATHGWNLVAQPGDLSPRSRTSVIWTEKDWPIKPDIVFEAGNYIHDGTLVSDDPDLSILTTGHDAPFKCFRDTSASSAAVARMAAILHGEYPDLWPETIRGLLVHSANWTPEMLQNGQALANTNTKNALLRTFGYGIPNLDIARFSASSRTCLISQQTIQPFIRIEDNNGRLAQSANFKEMNLHSLPWPQDYLREYGTTQIKLRVTLSYYIEPSPSRRIPVQQYSYASHQLRFDLQRPLEIPEMFRKRVNKKERPVGEEFTPADTTNNWALGVNTRNKGSISSDIWEGTAGQLADQGLIAVMPEGGWWKVRKHLNRSNQTARYALIITLESENQELDIYSQIQTQIANMTAIAVTSR